ncbi:MULTISPECIES: AAA family ATPase [Klebsiella]|uniref:Adenylyl-sulfate kinase n=1 Tax=Klebsiella pasteurii TaxID=2587529 RepID=A0A9Q9S5K1_9ENTR|nr:MULTISPECIES: AAA family ATPase [Klebsiella]MDS7870165.1 AAA family ATPase [Klebsiella pasteurii]MEC6164957.1 AAA family ATPase [Klebsiella grimontii]QZY80930.1 AAA family ATPase [Klebsiella sp. CTHL.F3a]UHC99886.1 AAA family ATPase [Klebsiella pasteurii]VUS46922.1 Adenylyl-sulfate kinase [Klebsiella pasteurii]
MLLIFGGLPGTGKSTIARLLAARLGAVWLRIDSIEQALIRAKTVTLHDIGPAGYLVAYAIAADNLRLGNVVIADSVNPIAITRQAWRAVATGNAVPFLEIELTCPDQTQHRYRVENRAADIRGHILPDWQKVITREYEPWRTASLTLDTSVLTAEEAVERILQHIQSGGLARR